MRNRYTTTSKGKMPKRFIDRISMTLMSTLIGGPLLFLLWLLINYADARSCSEEMFIGFGWYLGAVGCWALFSFISPWKVISIMSLIFKCFIEALEPED